MVAITGRPTEIKQGKLIKIPLAVVIVVELDIPTEYFSDARFLRTGKNNPLLILPSAIHVA